MPFKKKSQRSKRTGPPPPVTVGDQILDKSLLKHPLWDIVEAFQGAQQAVIADFFVPLFNDHLEWMNLAKQESKDAVRSCFGEKMVPKTPKRRGRKIDPLTASLQYFAAMHNNAVDESRHNLKIATPEVTTPKSKTPIQNNAGRTPASSRILRSQTKAVTTTAVTTPVKNSDQLTPKKTRDLTTQMIDQGQRTAESNKMNHILTPARKASPARVASPGRIATPDRTKAKHNQELGEERKEQIRKYDQKQKMAVKSKEELLREKTEKAKREREERQRRVAENNAARDREAQEKKRLIMERERTLEEFRRAQSPKRGLPPPRSPARPVQHRPIVIPSSPLPPPSKKTMVRDHSTAQSHSTIEQNDGENGRKKSMRLREAAQQKTRVDAKERAAIEEEEADQRRRQELQEAKMRLNVANSSQLSNKLLDHVKNPSSYELTPDKKPVPSTETNYNIEDLDSGDETDDDAAPRKKIPNWALGSSLKKALYDQHDKQFDLLYMFGRLQAPPLEVIFANKSGRFKKRTSSAIWNSPLADPRPGIGKFVSAKKV